MGKTYEKFTSELDEYIAKTKNRLAAILSALEWTEVDTLKESTCSGHKTLEEQKDDPCDPLLPESFESVHSIVINEENLKEILDSNTVVVAKKFSDIQLNFNREQKLALYDHVIQNTGKISEPELKVSLLQGDNETTFAEIVAKAKKKDKQLKRRYRTSKPTHTEEVRNLVHLQMQALAQYFNPKPSRHEEYPAPGCSDLSRARKRSRSRSRDRRRSKHTRDLSRSRLRISDEQKKVRVDTEARRSKKHSKTKNKKHSKSKHKSSKSKKHKHHRKSKKSND